MTERPKLLKVVGVRLCSIEGCDRKHYGKGFCNTHYAAARRGPAEPHKAIRACAVEGCLRSHRAKGLCSPHYMEHRRASNPAYKSKQLAATRRRNRERYREDPEFRRTKNAASKKWSESNKEHHAALILQWGKDHPQRRREIDLRSSAKRRTLSAVINPSGILEAIASGMRDCPCAKCGAPGPSQIDHILPLAWADIPEVAAVLGFPWAYQPLCGSCNSSKGARRVEVFVKLEPWQIEMLTAAAKAR